MAHSKPITKDDLDLTMSRAELNLKIAKCIDLIIALKVEAKAKPSAEHVHTLHKLFTIRLILLQELTERNIAARQLPNKWEIKSNG
jgi:hypothetical protein